MDYFKNVDKKVECTRTGFTDLHDGYLSNSIINVPVQEGFKSSSVLKKTEKAKKEAEKKAKSKASELAKKFDNGCLERYKRDATFTDKLSKFTKKGKKKVLKRILTEMYLDSLYVDEDFKLENFNQISNIVDKYVEDNGGYALIENAYARTNSPLVKKIMTICEETAKKACKRITEENVEKQEHENLNFDLNEDEVKEFDYAKGEIGLDQISTVIKDKVLNVVREEQEREAKHAELMEDIENELANDKNVVDPKSLQEALQKIFVQASPTEEATLFNSLLRDCYKTVIENENAMFRYECLSESVGEDEPVFFSNISLEDVELEEDSFLDRESDFDELVDEDVTEIFESHSDEIINAFENDGEHLEEALKNVSKKIKNLSKKTKSKKKALKIKKDIRTIQKQTEDLLPFVKGKAKEEGCKKAKEEACKKTVESFIDDMEESVDVIDSILEAHLNAELEVMESITEAKNGKQFVKPLVSKNDKKLKDINFMYKIKAIEKEINKISKSVKSERSGGKAIQLINKNLSILDKLKSSLSDGNKLIAVNTLQKKLEKVKKDMDKKIQSLRENYEFEDEFDYDMISMEDVQEGCFQEEIDFDEEDEEVYEVEECSTINMDMVLVEAIAKYTLLEMCHTLNLEKFDYNRVRRMSTGLLNKK